MLFKENRLYKILRNNYYAYMRGGKTKRWRFVLNRVLGYYGNDANFMPDNWPEVIVMIDGKSGNVNGLSDRSEAFFLFFHYVFVAKYRSKYIGHTLFC